MYNGLNRSELFHSYSIEKLNNGFQRLLLHQGLDFEFCNKPVLWIKYPVLPPNACATHISRNLLLLHPAEF